MMTGKLNINIRKLLIVLGLGVSVLTALLWLFSTDYPLFMKNRYLTGPVESFMNVNIGDKREDILYKFGKPDYVLAKTKCDDGTSGCAEAYPLDPPAKGFENLDINKYITHVYGEPNGYSRTIFIKFDKNNKTNGVTCIQNCHKIFGIQIATNEDDVIKFLGYPSISKIDPEDGQKTISYPSLNLTFILYEMKVSRIVIGSPIL